MRRPIKIALFAITAVGVTIVVAYLLFIRALHASSEQQRSSKEIEVTPEYAQAMRFAGYPISVTRAYQAGSYDGWHGDGSSVSIFQYPATESDALLAALKVRSPDYVWSETTSETSTLGGARSLIPSEFLPSARSSIIVEGKPAEGLPLLEYAVSPADGLLYTISNQY